MEKHGITLSESATLVDQAFWKVYRQLPTDYAEHFLERFVERLTDPKQCPDLPEDIRNKFINLLVSQLYELRVIVADDIKQTAPVALLDALYVTNPSKAMPTSPEMAEAAHNDVKDLSEQLLEVNTKIAAAKAEISAYRQVLKKGRELLENERLLGPAERDTWTRFGRLIANGDSGIASDEDDFEEDAQVGKGLLDDEDMENLVDAVPPPGKSKIRHSVLPLRKVGDQEDEPMEEDEMEDGAGAGVSTGGDITRVICSGMALDSSGSSSVKRDVSTERVSNKRVKKA